MLALSRKKNEALVINNNVEITILDIKGDQVKIGIEAPKEVPVYRKEVYLQIRQSNKDAMNTENTAENLEALKKMFT
ncbi:MAG: carbon storage regulator CsrA [Lachnospiraceae bacterium]|nr:carbon storage regulator CsrA [Lachnospiraceae bacterium]